MRIPSPLPHQLIGTLPARFQLLKEAIAVIIPESYNAGRIDGVIARRSSIKDTPMIYRKQSGLSISSIGSELSTPGGISDLYSSQTLSEYDPTQTARRSFEGSVSKGSSGGNAQNLISRSLSNKEPSSLTAQSSAPSTSLSSSSTSSSSPSSTSEKQKLKDSIKASRAQKSLTRSNSDSYVAAYSLKDESNTSTNSLDETLVTSKPPLQKKPSAIDLTRKNSLDKRGGSSVRGKKVKCFGVELGELLVREKALIPRFLESCGEYLSAVATTCTVEEMENAILVELNKNDKFYKSLLNFKYKHEKSKDDKFIAQDETPIEVSLCVCGGGGDIEKKNGVNFFNYFIYLYFYFHSFFFFFKLFIFFFISHTHTHNRSLLEPLLYISLTCLILCVIVCSLI